MWHPAECGAPATKMATARGLALGVNAVTVRFFPDACNEAD